MTAEQALFVADAREIIERLYRDLEELRVARLEGRRRRQLAAQIFRRVHTLKGSGASLGFDNISLIAHQFESVLDGARLGRIDLSDAVLNTFEAAVAALEQTLEPAASEPPDFGPVIKSLEQIAASSKQQSVIAAGLREALPDDIARALSEYDLQHAREAVREGARLFTVSASFPLESFDHDFRELNRLLGETGEVIATVPGQASTPSEISFRILYAAEILSAETLRRGAAFGTVEHSEIILDLPASDHPTSLERQSEQQQPNPVNESLRVEVRQVDELVSTASEIFRQVATSLLGVAVPANADLVEARLRNLRARFTDFEERLIKLRLVPVREIFERAIARGGRTTARQLGKKVDFVVAGGEVGIEKSLAEIISDPLLHLVRNAIIHGIEKPEERSAAGKHSTGKVTLAAANHSGRIHITVTDDGCGIDVERVIAAAAEHGISGGALSFDQCLRLIFRPGFSTASNLSELSGRGIGLDIVDRAMDTAGGEARVATTAGAGTTFAMIIPAGLSLIRCVVVESAGQLYAIDASCIVEDIGGGAEGEAVAAETPYLDLSSLFVQNTETPEARTTIVWQAPSYGSNGAKRYRVGVDAIITRQETLIRGLGRYASRWRGVCGAAEMFDGNVALVLDLAELISNN